MTAAIAPVWTPSTLRGENSQRQKRAKTGKAGEIAVVAAATATSEPAWMKDASAARLGQAGMLLSRLPAELLAALSTASRLQLLRALHSTTIKAGEGGQADTFSGGGSLVKLASLISSTLKVDPCGQGLKLLSYFCPDMIAIGTSSSVARATSRSSSSGRDV